MVTCAEEALGQDRLASIAAGDPPGLLEMGTLLGCL